ncbi:MAG: long-chain fatty acid--CoA ligase [Candidatus Omnitrophica bacterium]|nr:long-chain fatty acid--CoA ligase [Candidatus Omnitrophota bacterium]
MLQATPRPPRLPDLSVNERNLVDLLLIQTDRYQDRTALRVKKEGVYQDISWNQFLSSAIRIASALHKDGVQTGDRIALISENRPEWAYVDMAILALGAVVVPIYPTTSIQEVEYILRHCQASFLFASSEQADRLRPICKNLSGLKKIVLFDPFTSEPTIVSFADWIGSAGNIDEKAKALFCDWVAKVDLDDPATIIYTSGTTGPAKGVLLTHRNFLINCYDAKEALPLNDSDVLLSFLPLSHVFERVGGYYLSLLSGATIAYAENMNAVPLNLIEVQPTLACGVPRFFEKMYARIQAGVSEGGFLTQLIFNWASRVGRRSGQLRIQGKSLPLFLSFQSRLAQKLVYSKIYKKLGGRLRCFISGGAPLAKELAEFFYSVGVLILEGYGLTETSPVISVNHRDRFKFGSVGLPLRHVETKITAEGEIIVRGPSVIREYYQDEKATQASIRDGWFHTGDLGHMDEDGFLFITGRKKDIIKTSGGKMISPQNIENAILADPLFSQVVLVGDRHHFVTALVVPNFEHLKNYFKENGQVPAKTPREWVQDPLVHELVAKRIEERTSGLASYEKIKYFTLLARELSQEKGELTSTLKVKRAVVQEHFRDAIERMYQETENRAHAGRNRIFFVL